MKMGERKRKTDLLLVLLLFGVFAVCILSVLLTGADAYRRLAERDGASYDSRTASQYLATRVRQADVAGAVEIEDFHGVDALVFTEEIKGELYKTRVYCRGGYLRELFATAGGEFLPEDGEKILEAEGLEIVLEGRVLTADLTDAEGKTQQVVLYLRSEGEVA